MAGSRSCARERAPRIPPSLLHLMYQGCWLLGTPVSLGFPSPAQPGLLPTLAAPWPPPRWDPKWQRWADLPPLPGQAKQPGIGKLLRAGGQIDVRAHLGLASPLSPPGWKLRGAQGLALPPLLPQPRCCKGPAAARFGVPPVPVHPRLPHPNHPAWPAFATHFKQQTHNKPLLPAFSVPTLLPWGRSQHPCSQPRGLPQASAPHAAQFAPRVCTSGSSRAVPATPLFIQIHGGKLCSMVKEKQQ